MLRRELPAAVAVGGLAFVIYHATLLPGLDFGDTAFLQITTGSSVLTPRDGYPLYFALAAWFSRLIGGEPAHALNLVSAAEGALACGFLCLAACELSGSMLAGVASALLFAGSYTFWSQSIIAEVYALHILFVSLSMWLLLRWDAQPTHLHLVAFLGAYALGFGNHLSMILLAPGYALFLLVSASGGWRFVLAPRVWVSGCACALAGGLIYSSSLHSLWLEPLSPIRLSDALRTFWFDLTKADWRATLLFGVPRTLMRDHVSMYVFDLHQQFGWTALVVAALGLVRTISTNWQRAALIIGAYLANFLFALTYNVGDKHVFYMPSHLMVALLVAPGIVLIGDIATRTEAFVQNAQARVALKRLARPVVALALISYCAVRIHRDYPALDRSDDRRPSHLLEGLTAGLDDRRAILLTDLDWQIHNGLWYFARESRPEVAWTNVRDVLLYAPALINDNLSAGRTVALTTGARSILLAAYGPLIQATPDPAVKVPTITDVVRELTPGTRYVLCVLKPTKEFNLDQADLRSATNALSQGQLEGLPAGDYVVVAGVVGQRPVYVNGGGVPFRRSIDLAGLPVQVRMESWLAADTIRRMGFGHVVAGRHHALIVERGVSFVALDQTGAPLRTGYASSIFAPQPRYLCYR
jgi:hypothetical protein